MQTNRLMGIRLVTAVVGAAVLVASVSILAITHPSVSPETSETEAIGPDGEGCVKVGWIGEFMNWNPLCVDFVHDWVAYNLIFSTLFQYDEDWDEIHNHLATGYYQVEWPSGNMSTYINITKDAYFRNAENPENTSHPLTAEDVKFTFDLIQANPGNAWDYYLYNVTGTNVTGEHQVKIDTEYPKATLIDDLVWVPILPKFQWETITGPAILGHMNPDELIGSGAFYYEDGVVNDWHNFATAPNSHATADYGEDRDIDYDGIQFRIFTDIVGLVLAINNGYVDVVDITEAQLPEWNSVGVGASVPVTKQITQELGIYDIAINAIPLELREAIGYAESGNPILLDRTVREAIGMTLNKDELEHTYFHDMADQADTVLNPGFWHANLSNPLEFDPAAAKDLLIAAGYEDTDADGYLEVTEDSLAYTEYEVDVGEELRFRLDVPDSDPAYSTIGMAWVSWAEEAGIRFDFNSHPAGPMTNDMWYQCEYDLWVWSWYWGPEPLSNLACWLSNQIREGGYNSVGPICQGGLDEPDGWWWEDEENAIARCGFDDTFDEALRTVDVNDRKILVDELQEAIYETYTEFPPLHPIGQYAFTTARYDGWGNWTEHPARTIISDMLWIWYDLEPISTNTPPVALFEVSPTIGNVGQTFTLNASESYDGEDAASLLEVRWDFDGDDTWDSNWSTEKIVDHEYDAPGEYTVWLEVRDTEGYTDNATVDIVVMEVIPEFSGVLMPVLSLLLIVALIAWRRRGKE